MNFRSYDCVPLPRPVDSEDQLQQVETMEFGSLKSFFLEEYYLLEVFAILLCFFDSDSLINNFVCPFRGKFSIRQLKNAS
jgi:hypothetical protein